MGKILCATRGGEASYRSQDAAIALAKERGDELVFLYVVDLRFLDKTSAPIVVDVEGEMGKMGRFLLAMAHERAAAQGVEAGTLCREGKVREELIAAAQEEGATLIVLGKPSGEESAFELAGLKKFAARLEEDSGVEVHIA
ncbi:MAG: universal stress protein [Anaerolineae bacterium]